MIKIGDTVKVKNPQDYQSHFSKKISNRHGVVLSIFGERLKRVRVRFSKRGNRGKEFEEIIYLSDLESIHE